MEPFVEILSQQAENEGERHLHLVEVIHDIFFGVVLPMGRGETLRKLSNESDPKVQTTGQK